MPLFFHIEPPLRYTLRERNRLKHWLRQVVAAENARLGDLNFIYCTDDYLLDLNRQYLNHHTLTDVITFDHSDEAGLIAGDIFISIDRVKDNATQFKTSADDELRRVMVHGTLHLLGYGDKTADRKREMTQKENEYLALWQAETEQNLPKNVE